MRIEILSALFPPKWLAGTEIASYHIAKELARKGHEVHVVTRQDKGLPRESIEHGFYIHRSPSISLPAAAQFWDAVEFMSLTRSIDPDIVHVQGVLPECLFIQIFLAKPTVVWAQASEIYFPGRFYSKIALKLVLNNASQILALTNDAKKTIQSMCNREVRLTPNGVELETFSNLPSKVLVRDRFRIRNDGKVLLFVGTLRPVKGVQYLLQAMDIVHKTEPRTRLIIIGEGRERGKLERLTGDLGLGDLVNFTGMAPHQTIADYMAAADIFVLPSLSEGLPLTILEGMAAGLPIVTTGVRGLPEIIIEGENGFLVAPRNPPELARAILLLIQNEDLAVAIGANNRQKAKEYSWSVIVERLEDVYQSVKTRRIGA